MYEPADEMLERSETDLDAVVHVLRTGRAEILADWMDRVRDNRAVGAGQALSDPLLLDHMPQLFDAVIDRLAVNRSREDAEQFAAVHGFARRISGYDAVETVIELLMFRRAIWSHLTAVDAPVPGAFAAMERIDGIVDRSVIASLRAFLDPAARMLGHTNAGRNPAAHPEVATSNPSLSESRG
jgi:hypothetical protein